MSVVPQSCSCLMISLILPIETVKGGRERLSILRVRVMVATQRAILAMIIVTIQSLSLWLARITVIVATLTLRAGLKWVEQAARLFRAA